MSQNLHFREQIDACRPGTDDLSLPALADLAQVAESDRMIADEFARSQRFDRAVSTAMHDVPVPAGLLERLEAKLVEVDFSDAAESAGEVALSATRRPMSRRGLLAAAAALAAVVLIAIGGMYWPQAPRHVTNSELAELARGWFNQQLSPTAWKARSSAPPAYPVPAGVRGASRWQSFTTPAGQRGVVYDLAPAKLGPRARLFVVASHHQYDVQNIPYTRLTFASGGLAIGAWRAGGLLYVVVVEGDVHQLDQFLTPKIIASVPAPSRFAARPT